MLRTKGAAPRAANLDPAAAGCRCRRSGAPPSPPTPPPQAPPVAPALVERVRGFLEACEIDRNLSPLTIRQYDHYLNYFLGWVASEQTALRYLPAVTTEIVRRYKLALARHRTEHSDRALSRASQTYFLIALRSMLRYWSLQGLEVLAPDRIELGKAPSRSMKFLDPDQLRRLLDAPDVHDPRGVRDRALLETLFSTGLRLAQLARLDRGHINLKTREFGVIGKVLKPRVDFLSDAA